MNVLDKWSTIARYFKAFNEALMAGGMPELPPKLARVSPPAVDYAKPDQTLTKTQPGLLAALLRFLGALFGGKK